MINPPNDLLWSFSENVSLPEKPEKFTYPFFYKVHPLAKLAAEQLQDYLEESQNIEHNFGLGSHEHLLSIGKMFGVLVVEDQQGNLSFLAAFSGKLGERNHHPFFVPPVFDILEWDGFFKQGEKEINQINANLELLEKSLPGELVLKQSVFDSIQQEKKELKDAIKRNKIVRDSKRAEAQLLNLNNEQLADFQLQLATESKNEQIALKQKQRIWNARLEEAEKTFALFEDQLNILRNERKEKSNALQKKIFEHYTFLNKDHKNKSLNDIFAPTIFPVPPAGSGECAASKLLQYAFLHQLKPICMAEFWWGVSPKSEIRQHKQYYPACKGKCEPILGHMLSGMEIEKNPLLDNPAENRELPIIYEDEAIIVVDKPAEFLSVPGRNISDSVLTRIQAMRPDLDGPIIVHRLDMSTSGVLILTKTKEAYHYLQRQFIQRKVQKTYIALLEKTIEGRSGEINLPLTLDIMDRPKQKVDFETGKEAITYWEKIEDKNGQTKVKLFPKTGRTHQLRVHCAHVSGLNAPILGDDLYGTAGDRLHLHAFRLNVIHPSSRKEMTFVSEPPF